MSETNVDTEMTPAARMGRAIGKGVVIGIPITLVALTFGIWLLTDLDLADSFAASALPGVLLGGFAGGFAGTAATME